MDTAVFHNLAPDTNRIVHATRGHLVALWGCTCKFGNFSIPNNAKCLVICLNSAYNRPITTKLNIFFETSNFLHLGNRVISWILFENLLNKTINVSDLINLKRCSLCVRT